MERKNPRILALDPGTNCGYSWLDIPQPVPGTLNPYRHQSGVWRLSTDRFTSQGMRFVMLKKYLMDVEPDFVAYELVNFPHKSTAAAQMYWGVVTTVLLFCEEYGVEYWPVPTGTIKKRATGKGNAGKPQMIQAANVEFEIDPPLNDSKASTNTDDNIADAMWIAKCAIESFAYVLTKRDPTRDKETLNVGEE